MVAPAVDGIDLLTRATDLLNMFTAEKNVLGMWDSVDGGYFFGLRFSGTSPAHPGRAIVDRKRKEAGRQAIMLQAFHLANALTVHRYANMESRMLEVALRHIYQPAIHGVPSIVNANWSFQRFRNGTLNEMVTTEAMGTELESLFAVGRCVSG